ncbi:hypothetical protein [Rhodococcus tibetensis]|uniref:Uncharacterized protein n=1 Tax=Rhodococcus tibetensis TaxID=2965064 RepID=A0ABT1QHP0_9NOCA|nr:hypothetical protein [Rhodococcus sp. FXJ9.536]MCQ4121801.1 hypothetical protein [Rhodococcus sp. FXJ9.536]
MSIPVSGSTTPPVRASRRAGSISTEEIKFRIEAMFAGERSEPRPLRGDYAAPERMSV